MFSQEFTPATSAAQGAQAEYREDVSALLWRCVEISVILLQSRPHDGDALARFRAEKACFDAYYHGERRTLQ